MLSDHSSFVSFVSTFLPFFLLLLCLVVATESAPSNRDSDSHGTANTGGAATARSMLSRAIQEQREMRVNVPHRSGLRIPLARRMSKRPG